MPKAILWFRRDLRLADNPALQSILDDGLTPVPVFILDDPDTDWPLGAASAWWLHHSLAALKQSLQACGSDLLLYRGNSLTVLTRLLQQTGASRIAWNRGYEPATLTQDANIRTAFEKQGCEVSLCKASLLREPEQLLKKDGTPYRVFTPFWKKLHDLGPSRSVVQCPAKLPAITGRKKLGGVSLESLQLLPAIDWDKSFYSHWQPGEDGAWQALEEFCENVLLDYSTGRDVPASSGTSHLSAHLHFGEISPIQTWAYLHEHTAVDASHGSIAAAESYLREIAWREFSYHLLYHFPKTPLEPMDARFRKFPWKKNYQNALHRWQRGETGIPLVDAGMRELWETGYMHNRVRMIVASFLVKNLQIPWQEGARWFWDTLVDADLANNTMGWQWTSGCGVDAAPYFRIFNPVLQGQKFDKHGHYVRHWVPELAQLENRYVHRPWDADPGVLAEAGIVLGQDYPQPLTDLSASRRTALAAWDKVKRQTPK